ncbi:CBO0543 family protein [Paenibacillus silvisoli]|uniref:CBO0543 family protein n=1 Tax=Paenibacillus silvisoli TaxID=3110539 RepID=UPI0028062443|nr:CBO0543 family protein [Paenibacillus silvisoli]
MSLETYVLIAVWAFTALLLVIFINRNNFMRAQVSFMFMQVPCWLLGALVVQGRLINYPVGFLSVVYKSSFTFEYFVFPAVSAIFNCHFPQSKPKYIQVGYALLLPALITVVEIVLEKHTKLVKYINWSWQMSYISLTLILLLSYMYTQWFFRKVRA